MEMTQYPNYFVNQQGDVFSTKKGDIKKLKPSKIASGYLKIHIYNNDKAKQLYVHRLIAETFIPNPENKCDVNHKNGIKWDNRVENLEWNTRKENIDHAILNGLNNCIGENNITSKLNNEQVLEIRELYSQKKYDKKQLGKMYCVTRMAISNIINKKSWKHI